MSNKTLTFSFVKFALHMIICFLSFGQKGQNNLCEMVKCLQCIRPLFVSALDIS